MQAPAANLARVRNQFVVLKAQYHGVWGVVYLFELPYCKGRCASTFTQARMLTGIEAQM